MTTQERILELERIMSEHLRAIEDKLVQLDSRVVSESGMIAKKYKEIASNPDKVRSAIAWLWDNGYIDVAADQTIKVNQQYDLPEAREGE